MPVQHPNDPFRFVQATRAINHIPNIYGRYRQSGLFTAGMNDAGSTTLRFQRVNNTLVLVPQKSRGEDGTMQADEGREFLYMEIPHFPLHDQVSPEAVRGKVDFLTGKEVDTFANKKARVMMKHRNAMAITEEHLMAGAIKGVIQNEAGATIYNLFNQFGVTKKTIDFDFTTETTDINAVCKSVLRHIEDHLEGDVMSGVQVYTSPEFHDALVSHPEVQKAYANYQEAANRIGGDNRVGFTFGGLTFSEYTGKANGTAGVSDFIDTGKAQAFPLGTQEVFKLFPGPPVLNGINNVNMAVSAPMYALEKADDLGRWVDMYSELNVLPVCLKPLTIVELTMS